MEKAKQAKSAGELIALAKENGIELTEENARNIWNSFTGAASCTTMN